jgi:hypothetical protein
MDVTEAREVVKERMTGAQHHDPSIVQLPGGGWGRVKQTQGGGYVIQPTEAPVIEADEELEHAVNEMTRQELNVNTLAFVKKVALTPSLVMGHAYLSSKKDERGVPLFIGDVGDFINYCVRYTLKFGFGVEFAIASGKPTFHDFVGRSQND